jgi:hypothetical protein
MLRLYAGIVYGPQIIRHTYWGCFTIRRVIRHMWKNCLLTKNTLCAILRLDSTGAAPAESAASNKSWLAGETRKRPATLWSVAYRMGPSYRGP